MNKRTEKGNVLVRLGQRYKGLYSMTSITFAEAKRDFSGHKMILSTKLDGELSCAYFKKGGKPVMAGVHGSVKDGFPALDEAQVLAEGYFKATGKNEVYLLGELYVLDEHGHTLPFNQVESILKAPKPGQDGMFRFGVFNLFTDDNFILRGYDDYLNALNIIDKHFGGTLVHPVEFEAGDMNAFEKRWVDRILGEAYEGIVVMLDDGGYYKIKTQFNVDVVPIAMKKGKRWAEGMYSSVKVALMLKDGNFIELANPNAFGDNAQMKDDTTRWKKRKIYEEGEWFFFEPLEVAEIKYQEATVLAKRTMYDKNTLRDIGERDGVSLRSPNFVSWRPDKSVIQTDLRVEQLPEMRGSSGREEALKGMGITPSRGAKVAAKERVTPLSEKQHLINEPEKVPETPASGKVKSPLTPVPAPPPEPVAERKPTGISRMFDPKAVAGAVGRALGVKRPYLADALQTLIDRGMRDSTGHDYYWSVPLGGRDKDHLPDPPFAYILHKWGALYPDDPMGIAICGGAVRRWLCGEEPADYDVFIAAGVDLNNVKNFVASLGYTFDSMGPLGMAENWAKKGEPKIQLVTDLQPTEAWCAIKDFDWTVVQFAVASIGSDQLILLFREGSPLNLKEKVLAVNKIPNGDGKLISYRYVKYIKLGFNPTADAARDVSCAICEKWVISSTYRPSTTSTYPAPDTDWSIERWIKAMKGSP